MSDRCKEHFIEYFEAKVYDTIEKYELIPSQARILVGVSGGKDSLTVLYLLNKWFLGQVTAYAVDEGISGYRELTLADLDVFCEKYSIPLMKESMRNNFSLTLDTAISILQQTPCSACGVFRRYLLNKHREFDIIATGHNLDDEAQSILMNLIKNQRELLAMLGPRSGIRASEKFLPRVKPLYFCAEKEVMAYSFLKGFKSHFVECPYAHHSLRLQIRDSLNRYEHIHPGTKHNLVARFIEILPALKQEVRTHKTQTILSCSLCGEPTNNEICRSCELLSKLAPRMVTS